MKAWLGSGALALLSATASAGTWIVDDDGGPGVDFTSIAGAVAAAAPGDLILVKPGAYGTFWVNKPLKIVGQPAVPPTVSAGFLFFAQARVTLPGGEQRYTNSLPVLVR